jgi:hypothetical protein
MKTNVIMTSKDRELFGITIRQETKTGFLSISELQKAYNVAKWEYGWGESDISSLMQSKKMIERVYYILKERKIIETEFSVFTEQSKESGITKVLKNLGIWKTTGRGENRTVMCDPYIWVSIALELNPMIYARVVIWLTDSLIFDRVSAGRDYSPMNDSIKKILPNPEYYKYAIAINERVFGKHYPGMRNDASANELRTITRIEQFIISAISMNMIKNEEDILNIIKTMTI